MTNEELLQIIAQAARDNVTFLNLSDKGLKKLPPEIGQLKNLNALYLNDNELTTLPPEIGQLKNLNTLHLNFNELTTLPPEIGQLENLNLLFLWGNHLTMLPPEIGQLANLETLFLWVNELTTLPPEINKLKNLSTLYLGKNHLTTLPAEIGQLINLNSLNLNQNQLAALPVEIGQLINLNSLNLSQNQLTTLPAEIGQITNIEQLDLSQNQLTTLPPEIGQLQNLNSLNLNQNQLAALPVEIGQLQNLNSLNLNQNQLATLPVEIGQLQNLSELDLSNNLLTMLPSEIGQLTKLKELKLNNTRLETLPKETWKLTNLTLLDLRDGKIKILPDGIDRLSNLSKLNLRNNLLDTLPKEIWKLTNIKRLDLRGNKLPIPPEILGSADLRRNPGDSSTILNYYFQLQKEQKKPLNEAKMLLVGQGSVGKTSLIKRLIENCYDPHERKTEGINIQNWQITVNSQSIRLNVWDFGGQEIMHATHQFFLTKRSLYILVLDARVDEQQNKLEDWLKIIQSFGGADSPIIIVGNKIDQHPLDIDQRGLTQKYAAIKHILSISCQTGAGLKELQLAVTDELSRLDHIHDPLPQSWFQVKTRLEQMQKDYIPYSDYERLSQEEQVSDTLSQNTLIELLHQLGIVLHFRDEPRLAGMGVLNPEWVTNGVYKILNDNQLITEFRGMMDNAQLHRILDDPCYPSDKQLFIVDMMRKFELCFPLENGTGDRFLIPDLLPKEEPATGEWENVLAFQYHYNVLPSSIISRFIVRMHHLADRQTWWRSGIVLKHRNNRALVKSDREDRKIFISISGSQPTRRELLAMIRSQFEAIHQTIKGLIAEEKVPIPGHPHIIADYENLLIYEEKNLPYIPPGLTEPFDARQILDGIEPEIKRRERKGDREDRYSDTSKIKSSPVPEFEQEIFISYTLRDNHSEKLVEQIEQAFQAQGIKIIRDKNAVGYKEKFQEFMQRLSRGKCVIVVISDEYLKSENCMYELVEIAKNGEFYDRIFPVVLEDAKIYKGTERIKYVEYWEQQIQELDQAIKRVSGAKLKGFQEELNLYTDIRNTFDELTDLLRNMNTLNQDVHSKSGFEALQQAIALRLNE